MKKFLVNYPTLPPDRSQLLESELGDHFVVRSRRGQESLAERANMLEANSDLGTGTVTTTYTYDVANRLVTATNPDPSTGSGQAWHYEYDGNGSLIKVLPNGDEASGAKRYTYNGAGYLTQVESHNGSSWVSQAEMTYNGLGVRMTSSALGITTQYASDGQMPLAITSGGNTTTVLYGLGPIAEKTDVWNYVLNDGINLPRQLTDMDGEVTMFVRYNPVIRSNLGLVETCDHISAGTVSHAEQQREIRQFVSFVLKSF